MPWLRHLDWPSFLRGFFFVDVANLVILAWELVLRIGRTPGSSGLDDLRRMTWSANAELQDLVDDAMERARR